MTAVLQTQFSGRFKIHLGPADDGVQAFWDHLCWPRVLDPPHVAPDHKAD